MKFEKRQYQLDVVEAWYNAIKEGSTKPVVAVPTGAGKTVIMGAMIHAYLNDNPHNKVVVLSHTREILQQDHASLQVFFPDDEIGLYSAGLKSKTIGQITVAGIQSVYRKPELYEFTNLFIIDECHTVNHKNSGMYRSLLSKHRGQITGMSATVFRTGHGFIHENSTLFDHLAYDLTSVSNFTKLIDDGYLTNLIPISTKMQLDASKVKVSAGDYNVKDLGDTFDVESITKEACLETVKYGKNYKKWLVFAINIAHAERISRLLNAEGIAADTLHSDVVEDREEIINQFKNGSTRALVSVGMVTTGFDAPNVDLLVLLRPTKSAVLHVQMVGRGLRISPGKDHCLVLDFAGNTERLGPINDVLVPKKKRKGDGSAPVRKCPVCATLVHISKPACPTCGFEFPLPENTKLKTKASKHELVKRKEDKQKWLKVDNVNYHLHQKRGGHTSLRVVYNCGIQSVSDWVCLNHPRGSYPKVKADHWVTARGYTGGLTTEEVYTDSNRLRQPKSILVDFDGKYSAIRNAIF